MWPLRYEYGEHLQAPRTAGGRKGNVLNSLSIPFYVVMQNRPVACLRTRIPFKVLATILLGTLHSSPSNIRVA
jgi:hypothetical protein